MPMGIIWNEWALIRNTFSMAVVQDNPLKKEKEYVHDVYSQIADHFSDTRFKPWPRIAEFLTSLPSGSLVADIGCGNGKYLGVNKSLYMLGSDICPKLVAIAKGRGHEVMTTDCLSLPYRSGIFDAGICIAVLHHISTEERRVEAVREMVRVVRPGGQLLVYVWAMEQNKKKFETQDVMVPWHLQPRYTRGSEDRCGHISNTKKKRNRKKKERIEESENNSSQNGIDHVTSSDHTHSNIDHMTSSDHTHSNIDHMTSSDHTHSNIDHVTSSDHTRSNIDHMTSSDHTHSNIDHVTSSDHTHSNIDHVTSSDHTHSNIDHVSSSDHTHSNIDHVTSSDHSHHTHSNHVTSSDQTHSTSPDTKVINDSSKDRCTQLTDLGYKTYYRYYHVFCDKELVRVCECVPNVRVMEHWYDHENWCVLLERT